MKPVLQSKNNKLILHQAQLVGVRVEDTTLTADVAAASGTITVANIDKFTVSDVLLIGELGDENSEIILVHASTSPSGTTITLASNTVRAHSTGDKVYRLDYNQVELSHATTSTGSKTLLTTTLGSGLVALEADDEPLIYDEAQFTSGFYFARFYHSVDATNSEYSDAVPFDGWASNQVGYLIDAALKRNQAELSDEITPYFCYDTINECLDLFQGKQLRWEEHAVFNYVLGQTSRGVYSFSLPSDIYDSNSNKSIISVRVGDGQPIRYLDPIEFEEEIGGLITTQVTTQASAGATTLEIDNSYDFADSGSVNVYVSGTKYNITYTGVTRSATAGVLTGVPSSGTGSITVTIPVDTNVFQGESEGEPTWFTIRNGNLEISPMADASNDNENVYIDYWTVATQVDSDGDEIDVQRYQMVKHYLIWAIRAQIKNQGIRDENDKDYQQFREILGDAIRNKPRGLKYKMKPKVNRISYKNRT